MEWAKCNLEYVHVWVEKKKTNWTSEQATSNTVRNISGWQLVRRDDVMRRIEISMALQMYIH